MKTLHEHFENYIDECQYLKRLRPATLRTSRDAIAHFIRIMPELTYPEDVTPNMIAAFCNRLHTRERIVGKRTKVVGVKDSTIKSYTSKLSTFFRWLKVHGHIEIDPFEKLKFTNPTFTDRRALTGEEIKKIMGAIVQSKQNTFLLKRDIAMIGVLTFCGIRRTELINIEITDVDLVNRFLTIRAETSKSKRIRKIPINHDLRFYLQEYLTERKKRRCKTSYLFVSYGADKGLTLEGLTHWVKRLVRRSGVKFHVHRFRHTFATNLAMQDVGTVKIQKLMGHSNFKMTQTYLRSVSTEEMRDDMNKLSFENLA